MQYADLINQQGFAVVEGVVADDSRQTLLNALARVAKQGTRQHHGRSTTMRLLQALPEVQGLARSQSIHALVEPVLGPHCFAVRALVFDKTPTANWKVPWHQDVTIAVQAKRVAPGFGPWSIKAGVVHVQPPVALLARMLTVRVHLDDCGPEQGPVRVLPGSHRVGRLTGEAMSQWRTQVPPVLCTCARGDVLLMRPLLLHASSLAAIPSHRRVLHLEFAAEELPAGLTWYERW